jgi:hypothetical protein
MPVELEDLAPRLDLSFHFVLNLGVHERKLLECFRGAEVPANLPELDPGFFDLAVANQLTRRVWHEGRKANKQYDAPWYLYAKRETPLSRPIADSHRSVSRETVASIRGAHGA